MPIETKPRQIQFSEGHCFDAYELSLTFIARVDGNEITCLVSLDTIEDCFGCAWEDAEANFPLFRPHLEATARALIESGLVDSESVLRLRAANFSVASQE